jgi:DNA primase
MISTQLTENVFNTVKKAISITDVMSRFTSLSADTLDVSCFTGKCPLDGCGGKLKLNTQKEFFYCYGCHRGGDVITLLAYKYNVSSLHALKQLIHDYEIMIEEHK